jgi:hypothetical protein
MDVAASQLDGNYVRDEVADRSSFFLFFNEKVAPGLNLSLTEFPFISLDS